MWMGAQQESARPNGAGWHGAQRQSANGVPWGAMRRPTHHRARVEDHGRDLRLVEIRPGRGVVLQELRYVGEPSVVPHVGLGCVALRGDDPLVQGAGVDPVVRSPERNLAVRAVAVLRLHGLHPLPDDGFP
jgi:hypothetical protein